MSSEQAELLQTFRTFIESAEQGATIPPVDERDLISLHELCVERAKRYCGKDGVISIELTARVCSPGANLGAVWLRHTQLRTLYRVGRLSEWQHGTSLDPAVFHAAASFPMKGIQMDPEEFVCHLRSHATA